MTVEEMERLRDQAIAEAEALLYQTPYHDDVYAGKMAAAAAHATLASIWQARIDATGQEHRDLLERILDYGEAGYQEHHACRAAWHDAPR